MKYAIVSIDDARKDKKDAIRRAMHNHEEVTDIPFINGANERQLNRARERWPDVEPQGWTFSSAGELGVWYSQLNCWYWAAQNGDLLIYEDDAIVATDFDDRMTPILANLPSDWDFLSVFVPDNQLQDFRYRIVYDENGAPKTVVHPQDERYVYDIGNDYVTRVYQGYSCVANMVSQNGAKKLLERLKARRMYSCVDCFMYMEAHQGNLNGYAHHPEAPRPVTYDWNAPSIIRGHTDGDAHV